MADEANKQHWRVTWEKALANEVNKQHRHVTAVRENALADNAFEQHCQELAERAAALAKLSLAAEQAAVLTDLALPKPALAEDNWRQVKATANQRQAEDERFMSPVMLPNPVDAAMRRIWAECALRAVPLDALLAKIERDNIVHKDQAPPTTTLPHPSAMFSIPNCPMTYVGMVFSRMKGGTHATSLTLALLALPLPTIDG